VLENPLISRDERKDFITRLLKGRVSSLMLHLLYLLVEKGRAKFLPLIAETYHQLADEVRGILRTQVSSFLPLTNQERRALVQKLTSMTGKKIVLEERVDPALLGGMRLQMGDEVIDGTVAGRLKELRETLLRR
jgi:F-type H+-transporting ATPase subunit delta